MGGEAAGGPVVAKVEQPAKNSKRITDWIKSIGDIQKVTGLLHWVAQAAVCDAPSAHSRGQSCIVGVDGSSTK